jgi:hypothetical protein
MAALIGIGLLSAIWAPEPVSDEASSRPETLVDAVYLPFVDFSSVQASFEVSSSWPLLSSTSSVITWRQI